MTALRLYWSGIGWRNSGKATVQKLAVRCSSTLCSLLEEKLLSSLGIKECYKAISQGKGLVYWLSEMEGASLKLGS